MRRLCLFLLSFKGKCRYETLKVPSFGGTIFWWFWIWERYRLEETVRFDPKFLATWRDGGMSEEDLRSLELRLLDDAKVGDVVPGTYGLRKVRVAVSGKGRRGGGRVLYRDFERFEQLFFLFFIRKGEQEDLDADQRRSVTRAMRAIEAELERRFG